MADANTHQQTAEPFKNGSGNAGIDAPQGKVPCQNIGKTSSRWYLHTFQLSLLSFKLDSVPPFLSVSLSFPAWCRKSFTNPAGVLKERQAIPPLTKSLTSHTCWTGVQYPHTDEYSHKQYIIYKAYTYIFILIANCRYSIQPTVYLVPHLGLAKIMPENGLPKVTRCHIAMV